MTLTAAPPKILRENHQQKGNHPATEDHCVANPNISPCCIPVSIPLYSSPTTAVPASRIHSLLNSTKTTTQVFFFFSIKSKQEARRSNLMVSSANDHFTVNIAPVQL